MQAITLTEPPQRPQTSMSILNTLFRRWAQVNNNNWAPGGSGLVSTLSDYMRFALMLWNRGEYRGARVLKQETVDNMFQPHVTEGVLLREGIEGLGWGLGLSVVADAEA